MVTLNAVKRLFHVLVRFAVRSKKASLDRYFLYDQKGNCLCFEEGIHLVDIRCNFLFDSCSLNPSCRETMNSKKEIKYFLSAERILQSYFSCLAGCGIWTAVIKCQIGEVHMKIRQNVFSAAFCQQYHFALVSTRVVKDNKHTN